MPQKSRYPDLKLPSCNLLTYLYSRPGALTDEPLWVDNKDENKSLSTKQIVQLVKRLGCGLQKLGLKRGDVVLICTTNHIYVPIAYLGIVGSTCIFSGANPAYTVPELTHQLSNTAAKLILVHPKKLDEVLEAAAKVKFPKKRIFQFTDSFCAPRHDVRDWSAILAYLEEGAKWQWPELSADEAKKTIATINYSSGTTGLPKGVCISHANLCANVEQSMFMRYAETEYQGRSELAPRERWVGFLPLYHAFGQLYTILMATRFKSTVYLMSEFNFEELLWTIQKYKIMCLHLAPPILVMLSKRPEVKKYDLSSLETMLSGAAPLSRELMQECKDRFSVKLRQGWGMTEVTCGGIQLPGGMTDTTGAVGCVFPNCEVRLLDDEGKEVGAGQPGELYIRGPNTCMGYWKNEEATKETLVDGGWLKTGDVAQFDDKGLFRVVDRKKELIKVNALQVAPAELEATLLENEHVADAAVVGIYLGGSEWPRAYVVIQDASKEKVTPKDIQDWVATRVSKHKRLEGGVSFVDAVPKLQSGKIVRKQMREWAKRDAAAMEKDATGVVAKARL